MGTRRFGAAFLFWGLAKLKIVTPHLTLSPYTQRDLALMQGLHGDARVMATMKGGLPIAPVEAAEIFKRYLAAWKRDDLSIFAVRHREDEAFIGECGFWYRGDRPGVSMRYLLLPAYWGQGLGLEMAKAATHWLFNETDVSAFWAITQANNLSSIAILRRLGATLSDERCLGQDGLYLFECSQSAWREAQANIQATS